MNSSEIQHRINAVLARSGASTDELVELAKLASQLRTESYLEGMRDQREIQNERRAQAR